MTSPHIVFEVDTSGLNAALDRLAREMGRSVPEASAMIADRIAVRAKQTATFRDRTSLLRKSIRRGQTRVERGGDEVTTDALAGNNGVLRYASYIEDGTRHIRGFHYMRNAADSVETEAVQLLDSALMDAISAAGLGGI